MAKNPENQTPDNSQAGSTRRAFLKTGAAVSAAASVAASPSLSLARSANVRGSNTFKVGLIGAGGRGRGASINAMSAPGVNVELHAVADVFEKRAADAVEQCKEQKGDKVQANADTTFVGLDAWKQVLDSGVDMVILATPPGFRPMHFEKAIDAGKHVFMEKPVAVDAAGVRRVIAAGEKASENKLTVQVGLQRRHEPCYRDAITRIQEGIIGDLSYGRVYWNGGGVWNRPRDADDSELMYQLRNWYYFNWMCGDHIVEQHIHNLDVINWVKGGFPVQAQGTGGRLVRKGKKNGEIFDHHVVEYTYEDGFQMFSFCRHIPKCWNHVGEYVYGSKGYANLSKGKIYDNDNKVIFEAENTKHRGHQWEHDDMFKNLVDGIYVNEAEYGAKSTFTAILGRLATYSGKVVEWDQALAGSRDLADVDSITKLDGPAPVTPLDDGTYAVPVPGVDAKSILGTKKGPGGKRKRRS